MKKNKWAKGVDTWDRVRIIIVRLLLATINKEGNVVKELQNLEDLADAYCNAAEELMQAAEELAVELGQILAPTMKSDDPYIKGPVFCKWGPGWPASSAGLLA